MSYNEQVIYTCKHCEKDKISEPVGQVVLKIPCPGPTLHNIDLNNLIQNYITNKSKNQEEMEDWKCLQCSQRKGCTKASEWILPAESNFMVIAIQRLNWQNGMLVINHQKLQNPSQNITIQRYKI